MCPKKDVPEEPGEVTHVNVSYTSKKGEKIEFGFDKEASGNTHGWSREISAALGKGAGK